MAAISINSMYIFISSPSSPVDPALSRLSKKRSIN